MTDRELLEMAARAAGLKIDADGWMPIDRDRLGLLILNDKGGHTIWSPLTDDGDALRLAVNLRLRIEHFSVTSYGADRVAASIGLKPELYGKDPYAATRRAIVRAAAEIGKAMND